MRILASIALASLLAAPLAAQKQKPEPLTEDQQDKIAEAGVDPVARVVLYIRFIDERSERIKALVPRAKSQARAERLDDELQNFAALVDELGDNLDVFSQRKADIRRSLKALNEGVARWQDTLHGVTSEPIFELSLKDALASVSDLSDQAKEISADQAAYFKAHPDEKGQDRYEPK